MLAEFLKETGDESHGDTDLHRPKPWMTWILTLILLVVAALTRLTDLDVFIGPDEFSWVTRPANFFWALTRADFASTYQTGHPGVFLMWVNLIITLLKYAFLSVAGRQPDLITLFGPENTMAMLATKRWEMVLVSTLMVVGMFWLGRRVFGTRVAFLGTLLVALDPFFLSESRQLRTEAPAASLMMLSLLAFLDYMRWKRQRYMWSAAVLAALAFLSRNPSLFLLPFFELMLAFEFIQRWRVAKRPPWRSTLYAAFVVGLVPLILIFALWPALWVAPVETLSTTEFYTEIRVEEGKEDAGVFFMGQIFPDDPGWLFYPVSLLFRTTPLAWIGVIAAVGGLLAGLLARKWRPLPEGGLPVEPHPPSNPTGMLTRWLYWWVLVLLLYSFLYTLMISFSALKFERYLSPVFPALDFLAAIGLYWLAVGVAYLWRTVRGKAGSEKTALWVGMALLVILSQGIICWAHHPYYLTYFHPWLGGIQRAQNVLRIGYGEGLDQVAAYLNIKPDAEKIKLASAMSSRIGPILEGGTIPLGNLDGRWVQADYVLIYISQLQRGKHFPEMLSYLARREPEFILGLHGVEYGWLYPGPTAQYYSGTKLEGRGTLYGYDLSATELRAGDVLTATLYWRNEGQQPADDFFVELEDAAGYRWVTAYARPRPGFEEAAQTRKEIVESDATLSLPIGMPPGHYVLKMGFVTDGGQTLVGRFELPDDGDDVMVGLPAAFPGADEVEVPVALDFGLADVSLLGYDLRPGEIEAGERGWLTLYWRAERDRPRDYVVGIRLLGVGGEEITYWLGRPVYSGYGTSEWLAGQVVQDPWELEVPEDVEAGAYELELVLFDAETGEPLARTPLTTWSVIGP